MNNEQESCRLRSHGSHGDRVLRRYISTGVTSLEEGHAVERVNVRRSDVDKDTMSATVKLAKDIDELDIGQPTRNAS